MARADEIIAAATELFLRHGYAFASIDKVARKAGVSTRTIYGRYKNKADLLATVIARLVYINIPLVLSPEALDHLDLEQALHTIGDIVTKSVVTPEFAALFRIVATEAYRFPELAVKMRESTKTRVDDAVAKYFQIQMGQGKITLKDPHSAAVLFVQMISAELHDCLLFGAPEEIGKRDFKAHVNEVIDVFLRGIIPRPDEVSRNVV